jgi:MinD-like ATPase involved in chromosome partitioning or flagellar assembly
MNPVVGVVGGSGGVGTSTFAAVLAAVAGPSLLVDLDVSGGGVDVLLGIEGRPGVRWSGLRVAGGRLDPLELTERLPHWGPVSVLAADSCDVDAAAVLQVLVAARTGGPVVLDLPRGNCPERAAALLSCDLVVVLARADVSGLVAAHAVTAALPEVPVGVVARRGSVAAAEAAALVGRPLLGELPALSGTAPDLRPDRPPRAAARVATGVLAGLRTVGRAS